MMQGKMFLLVMAGILVGLVLALILPENVEGMTVVAGAFLVGCVAAVLLKEVRP